MRRCVGLALSMCLIGGVAMAADVEVPAEFHGTWAAPACNSEAAVLAFLSHGSLEINPDGVQYHPVETLEASGDWVKQTQNDAVSFMRLTDPSTLRTAVATVPDPEPVAPPKKGQKPQAAKPRLPLAGPPGDKDPPDAWAFTDYVRCPSLPSAYAFTHGEALGVLMGLDQLRSVCGSDTASVDAACATGLFKLADVSGNNELSVAELARLGRVATYFAAAMSGEPVGVAEILAAYAGAVALTPLIAKAIVSSFDYDDSGALSLAELMQNREGLLESAGTQGLSMAARPKVEGLIEQLKGAEQMLKLLMQ